MSRSFTANEGRFDLADGCEVLELSLWIPGFAGYRRCFEGTTPREVEVELQLGATIVVRAVDDEGHVRRGWPMQLTGENVDYRHALERLCDGNDCTTMTQWEGPHRTDGLAKTDENGTALFLHVLPGTYGLRAPQLARWAAQEVRVAGLGAGEVRHVDFVVPARPVQSWGGFRFPLEGTRFEVTYDGVVRDHIFSIDDARAFALDVVDGEVWVVVNGERGERIRGRIEPPSFMPARLRLERDGATSFTSEPIEIVVGSAPRVLAILRGASPR